MNQRNELSGQFKIELAKADQNGNEIDGTRYVAIDWFSNLITDYGLNFIGNNGYYLGRCHVGSGTTAPTPSDIVLENWVDLTSVKETVENGINEIDNYAWIRIKYKFDVGIVGDLTEVGIGAGTLPSDSLFSRALFPTTLTIASDDILYVTYELRVYPKLTDVIGSVTFSGNLGGTYNWTMRSSLVNSTLNWFINQYTDHHMGKSMDSNWNFVLPNAYDSTIGLVTDKPSGNSLPSSYFESFPYINGSLEREFVCVFYPKDGNLTGGIKSIGDIQMGFGCFQVEFDQPILKTTSNQISIRFKHTWNRKV